MPLTINVTRAAAAAPLAYTVPASAEVEPLAASATYDGTSASGPFLPALGFYSASGLLIARVFPGTTVAPGTTADVSFAPGLSDAGSSGQPSAITKTISAASTNATLVQAGATRLTGYFVSNVNALPRYLKLYDKASSPTVGTDVPKWTIGIPGAAAANVGFDYPLAFTLGLAFALTTGVADTDATAVAANEIVVNLSIA